jgi:AcrR family transcriptional regulator
VSQRAKPRRVTKRRAETRERLLDAAMEVFADEGFGRASVEGVCARAGYTRGAFYSNFVSLDEMFLAMWEQRTEVLLRSAAEAIEATEREPVATLAQGIDRVLDVAVVDEAWYRVQAEFTAHALRTPGLRRVLADREARIAELLLPFLERALRQVGRRMLDREAFVAALVAVHEGTAGQVLVEPDHPVVRERRRKLFLAVVDSYTETDARGRA